MGEWIDYPDAPQSPRPPMTPQRRRALLLIDAAWATAKAIDTRLKAERDAAPPAVAVAPPPRRAGRGGGGKGTVAA